MKKVTLWTDRFCVGDTAPASLSHGVAAQFEHTQKFEASHMSTATQVFERSYNFKGNSTVRLQPPALQSLNSHPLWHDHQTQQITKAGTSSKRSGSDFGPMAALAIDSCLHYIILDQTAI